MSPTGFDKKHGDIPFVAGSFTGIRAFRVGHRPTGRYLLACTCPSNWVPGVNLATCRGEDYGTTLYQDHKVADRDCSCGFYGYFGSTPMVQVPHSTYNTSGTIMGIVEAWGSVTYGHYGFRASKAKVVALVDPHGGQPPVKVPYKDWRDRLTSYWLVVWPAWTTGSFCYWGIGEGSLSFWLYLVLMVLSYIVLGLFFINRHLHRRTVNLRARGTDLLSTDLKALAKKYDVPIYNSIEEAVKAHPLTSYDDTPEGRVELERKKQQAQAMKRANESYQKRIINLKNPYGI